MLALTLEIRPRSPELLIGGRSDPSRGGDKATARDASGRLVIPASALRGALRYELERLLRAQGSDACGANDAPDNGSPTCACPVCRLFGSEGSATGSLRLEDAVLDGEEAEPRLRPQVAVSRSTGSAVARHLAFSETGGVLLAHDHGPVFRARGRLVPLGTSDDGLDGDRTHLTAACRAVSGIGGGRSRGLGWVECELKVDEPPPTSTSLPPAATPDRVTPSLVAPTPRLRIVLEALAPLHLGSGRPIGYFHRSLRHVPASTLRGALAFALLDGGLATPDESGFQALFGDGATASFGSARLEGPPPSATARRCRPAGHVFDDLLAELLWREAAARGVALALTDAGLCPGSDCRADKVVPMHWQPQVDELDVRIRTRTALNRRTATSMDAKLFSIEVLEPRLRDDRPVRFVAEIDGLSEAASAVLLRLDGREAWVGGKRSQGYGRCRLRVESAATSSFDELQRRLQRFDDTLRSAWTTVAAATDISADLLPADSVYLPVVLDEPWLPTDAVARDAFAAGPLDLPARHRFLLTTPVGAFGAIEARRFGAPDTVPTGEQPPVSALAAGSVFVYEAPRDRLPEILAGLGMSPARGSSRTLGRGRLRLWEATSLTQPGGSSRA